MPYTPPSHRSPASSTSASPNASRRPSLVSAQRPTLPRSASYLNKHRRTPSFTGLSDGASAPLTPQDTSDDLKGMASLAVSVVRQSPPPVTNENGMPAQAVISPPESASSGSDDEEPSKEQALREAVHQIPQTRTPSPPPDTNTTDDQLETPNVNMRNAFSTSALDSMSAAGRKKAGHARSRTESHIVPKSADNSITASDEDTDEDLKFKPQMVRKKSGELVRPALRPKSGRRPSSMPGTPIFSKAVHFDSHLEHVRHFLQVDRPLAVSANSSPAADNYESDNEYPFPGRSSGTRSPPYEWEIVTCNFPHDSVARKSLPVRLERVWLSTDQKTLLGSVAVSNIAFQKSVTCRFTLDYWKTTSEIAAEYSHEIRPKETPLGQDRFTFSIKLADTADLASKTLFFCIRYAVADQTFWDNNSSANFQVDFRKKHLPQNGKNGFSGASSRPLNGLPRSNRRGNTMPRPKSFPLPMDDMDHDDELKFDQPIHEYLGETGPLRLKTKSSGNLASDNIAKGLSSPSGVAFANRYDFGASLSAAVQAAKDTMGKEKDTLYMRKHVRSTAAHTAPVTTGNSHNNSGTGSPNSSTLPSASYEELVNKYCFFGSNKTSPTMQDGTLSNDKADASTGVARLDGAAPEPVASTRQVRSAAPVQAPGFRVPRSGLAKSSVQSQDFATTEPRSTIYSPLATPLSTPGSDMPHHAPHQVITDRFPWTGDAHAPTIIQN